MNDERMMKLASVKAGLEALFAELSAIRKDEAEDVRRAEAACEDVDLLGLPVGGFEREMRVVLHFMEDAVDHVSAAIDEVVAALDGKEAGV